MYRAIRRNKVNTVFIILMFIVLIAVLGYAASLLFGNWTITIWALVGASIYAVIQYFMAGRAAVAMSGAREITKAENPRLWRIVENLAITTGTPMPKVYIMDDPAPNAFATGRDPEHAIVCATSGILELMTDRELTGVMAHEMGHVRNYDIRLNMIVFGLVAAIGMVADILMRMSFWSGMTGGNRNNNNGGGNPIMLVVGIAAAVLAPLAATMVQLAVSRQREYLADATGALTTRDPEALASALDKLQRYSQPLVRQNSAMAHMYIADPLKSGFVDRLFATHPPIPDRIRRLLNSADKF
ncbi:M48 family metalloprotease [Pseudoclavibacter sp. CFCC 11306]|uniref:M48 family metalloprotease n=1 Tax=Pseudoclavibacter sp. CFCC 11306 TaxID=1564493 RepID=UPI0013011CD9|nr:M48 family metalloprotease [Pseudoclavibacter sp. CFCC 11306]KAB1657155.1 M48 family metalloprotease [Pseudoclavibacter sp. CFCC 11306]